MKKCRVCGSAATPLFYSAPRSILGIARPISAEITVSACKQCGHAQSEDINFAKFYDAEYRFQLSSQEFDELVAVVEGRKIYRSDLQAEIALDLLDLSPGRRILDHGAAKAATLRKICASRPGLVPHVYDVSADYRPVWDDWLPRRQQAIHELPDEWHGSFDVIQSFFVLEHVEDPNAVLRTLASMLAPDGQLLLIVPNPIDNVSDFVVFEHVSHFTRSSLTRALHANGLAVEQYSTQRMFGAQGVIGRKRATAMPLVDAAGDFGKLAKVADYWKTAQDRLRQAADRHAGRPSAIYGASVYGCYIATRVEGRANLRTFVDRNPHLWGKSDFGIPIVPPGGLPEEVEVVYAGVNPIKAREILADVPEWKDRRLDFVFLDGSPSLRDAFPSRGLQSRRRKSTTSPTRSAVRGTRTPTSTTPGSSKRLPPTVAAGMPYRFPPAPQPFTSPCWRWASARAMK